MRRSILRPSGASYPFRLLSVTPLDSDRRFRSDGREQSQKDLIGILKTVSFLSHTACSSTASSGLVVDAELRNLVSFVVYIR